MKFLKLFCLCLVFTLLFSLGVSAKAETFQASVEKLLVLTKQDQLTEQVFPQLKPLLLQQVQQMNTSPEQSPIVEKYLGEMIDVMKEEMSWDKMKNDFIQLYMSVYTEEEVRQMITFYESPIGQKMIDKMPVLMQQSMMISQKYTQKMMPKIQEITQAMMTELQTGSKKDN